MRTKSIIQVALLAAAIAIVPTVSAEPPPPSVGSEAPPLELQGADGSSRSLAAIDGPRVLIFYRGLW